MFQPIGEKKRSNLELVCNLTGKQEATLQNGGKEQVIGTWCGHAEGVDPSRLQRKSGSQHRSEALDTSEGRKPLGHQFSFQEGHGRVIIRCRLQGGQGFWAQSSSRYLHSDTTEMAHPHLHLLKHEIAGEAVPCSVPPVPSTEKS